MLAVLTDPNANIPQLLKTAAANVNTILANSSRNHVRGRGCAGARPRACPAHPPPGRALAEAGGGQEWQGRDAAKPGPPGPAAGSDRWRSGRKVRRNRRHTGS